MNYGSAALWNYKCCPSALSKLLTFQWRMEMGFFSGLDPSHCLLLFITSSIRYIDLHEIILVFNVCVTSARVIRVTYVCRLTLCALVN